MTGEPLDPSSQPTVTGALAQVEAAFDELLELEGAPRAARLERLRQEEPALAAEVEALLGAHRAEAAATSARRQAPPAVEVPPPLRRMGPYLLESLLGRGGMGAVYLAHRADGQYERKVAIKLIDHPLVSEGLKERFRQERQILAGLEHPSIARMLEGGVSEEGELYLVMEYVKGAPIHRFCQARGLSRDQRLALFTRVCEAVEFAHRNLVVHRDLKPDNILVDEAGAPHLLDFGTARLLTPDGESQRGEDTRQGFLTFTPQYASPEQVWGKGISTASDSYSLGVLLYLLLTDQLPYQVKDFSTEALVRVVCEQPPRPPVAPPGSEGRLDADLVAILERALRKEPEARYRGPGQLAADVQAYLQGRPVSARDGTVRYTLGKFVRRNALAVGTGALLALSLVGGLAAVLWQAREVDRQRKVAEATSVELRRLSKGLLLELDEAIKQLPGTTGTQKLLVTRVLEHLDRMARDAQDDRLTQLDLADAYIRLGNLQGNPYDQNLGDAAGGAASLEKALSLLRPLASGAPADRSALRTLASALQSRSEVLFGMQRSQEAVALMRESVQTYERLAADPAAPAQLVSEAAAALGTLGDELGQSGTASLGDAVGALAAYRRDAELNARALALDPGMLRARRGLCVIQLKLGNLELEKDPAQALADYRLALEQYATLPAADRETSLSTRRLRLTLLRKKGLALEALAAYPEAIADLEEVAAGFQQLAEADPQDLRALYDVQIVLDDEGGSYADWADPGLGGPPAERQAHLAKAHQLLSRAQGVGERLVKKDPANVTWRQSLAYRRVRLAALQQALERPAPPLQEVRAALSELVALAASPEVSPQVLDSAAAAFLEVEPRSLRDPRLAVAYAEREVAMSHRQAPLRLLTLAQAYRAAGEAARGRAAAEEGLGLLPPLAPGAARPRTRRLLEAAASPTP